MDQDNVLRRSSFVNPNNRAGQRRLERLARAAAKTNSCFICGKPFPAMGSLLMGTTKDGREGTAGDCCKAKLATIEAIGINYVPGARS